MTGQDWMEKDFYAALGVPKDADDAAVKKAYRKLARQYHPDQNQGDTAAEAKFKEIGEAYSVLSDKEQRKQYDTLRAMAGGGARFQAGGPGGGAGFEDVFGGMFGGGGPGGGNVRFSTGSPGMGSMGGGGFSDILGGLFGGGGMGGFGGRGPQAGADLAAAYTMSFTQAVAGATVELGIDGRTIKTKIPAGIADGAKLRIRGKGRPSPNGGQPGDLVLTVHVDKHPVFTLDGKNLRMNLPVSFVEAALGAQIEVPTLDGDHVTVKVAAGTPSGRVLRVKGRGVKTAKGDGDLLITVQVAVPQKLSRKAKQALENFQAELGDANPRADLAAQVAKASR
jgi:molecular chaperone DnaJ